MRTFNKSVFISLIGITVLAVAAIGIKHFSNAPTTTVVSRAESTKPTRTDQRILRAKQQIEQLRKASAGYNQLAAAYMQKARETGDFNFNANADDALNRSLGVEVDNYDALKLRAKLQLTYHRFSEALQTARQAQRVRVDDNDVWGLITDALVELGDYPGAVEAAQKMVNLRPDSSSYARVSYLRSLHGDTVGAIQAMNLALRTADPNDPEGIAWCRAQLGNELLNAGKLEAAEAQFDQALRTFPDHRLASHGKASVRLASGDLQAAVEIYERERRTGASADASQALGDLYRMLGQEGAAQNEYRKFEVLERENAILERSWRHMVNYWLDHNQNLEEALTLITDEYKTRKDIFTCDSMAWALFKNGRLQDARKLINEALRTNTSDARINYHAGVIYKSLNMRKEAASHLRLGAALNSAFDPAQSQEAKRLLTEL